MDYPDVAEKTGKAEDLTGIGLKSGTGRRQLHCRNQGRGLCRW